MADLALRKNDKIVFIGDSITDCGRRNEPHGPYGTGYVSMVRNLLIARYPGLNLTIENRGVGGNTIRDLKARWQQDVIDEKPTFLSVKIGINDVWRAVSGRDSEAVLLDEYETTYRELLQRTREEVGPRFMLVDPYVLETNRDDPFRKSMDQYVEAVHRLAGEFGAISARTQEAFDAAMSQQPSSYWAGDRVHPGAPGHAVIALTVLRGLGFSPE